MSPRSNLKISPHYVGSAWNGMAPIIMTEQHIVLSVSCIHIYPYYLEYYTSRTIQKQEVVAQEEPKEEQKI